MRLRRRFRRAASCSRVLEVRSASLMLFTRLVNPIVGIPSLFLFKQAVSTVDLESINPRARTTPPALKRSPSGSNGMRNESPRGADTGRYGNCAATAQRDSGCSRRCCVSVCAAPTASCGDQMGYSPGASAAPSSWASSAVRNCMARNFSERGNLCRAGSNSASFMAGLDYCQPMSWQVPV